MKCVVTELGGQRDPPWATHQFSDDSSCVESDSVDAKTDSKVRSGSSSDSGSSCGLEVVEVYGKTGVLKVQLGSAVHAVLPTQSQHTSSTSAISRLS
jgi:hypothetical protein